MSFRDEFFSTGEAHAGTSLKLATASGLRTNQELLKELQQHVRSEFRDGVECITRSQMEAAASLKAELVYQVDRIESVIRAGADDVVASIQQMGDYIGSELCEVRWSVERQTKVSSGILQTLLNSLDNDSRQYFEQGVKCYETGEYDFAWERFNKALEANRTNYFAYQYLGFVAAIKDAPDEAIRNFELAGKFAGSGYHRALALSHSARSKYATGDLGHAVSDAKSATESYPGAAKFWYELSSYKALLRRAAEAVEALREAILRDWTYWAVVIQDSNFESVRPDVLGLLNQLRNGERAKARRALNHFASAVEIAREALSAAQIQPFIEARKHLEARHAENNVFVYREIVPDTRSRVDGIIQTAAAAFQGKLAQAETAERKLQEQHNDHINSIKMKGNGPFVLAALAYVISTVVLLALIFLGAGYISQAAGLEGFVLLLVAGPTLISLLPAAATYFIVAASKESRIESEILRLADSRDVQLSSLRAERAKAEFHLSSLWTLQREMSTSLI
jgi:tetratricopeptide (TPR) repeat protein